MQVKVQIRLLLFFLAIWFCRFRFVTAAEFFVSANYGNDGGTGVSVTSPFKTLDRAVAVANSNDTVRVLPGRYGYPTNYCNRIGTKPLAFISVGGLEQTVIDADENSVGTVPTVMGPKMVGLSFEGFTFRGAVATYRTMPSGKEGYYEDYYYEGCAFAYVSLRNCRIVSVCVTHSWQPFFFRVFLDGCVCELGAQSYSDSVASDLIMESNILNSRLFITNNLPDNIVLLGRWTRFENSYIETDMVYSPALNNYRSARKELYGGEAGMYGCTVVAESWYAAPKSPQRIVNSILGIGDGNFTDSDQIVDSILVSRTVAEANLGDDHRPLPLSWRGVGWNPQDDSDPPDGSAASVSPFVSYASTMWGLHNSSMGRGAAFANGGGCTNTVNVGVNAGAFAVNAVGSVFLGVGAGMAQSGADRATVIGNGVSSRGTGTVAVGTRSDLSAVWIGGRTMLDMLSDEFPLRLKFNMDDGQLYLITNGIPAATVIFSAL